MLFSVSAFSIGQAIQANNGFLDSEGLVWLAAGILTCMAGMAGFANRALSGLGERLTTAVLTCAVSFQLYQLFRYGSFRHVRLENINEYRSYLLAIFLAAVAFVILAAGSRLTRRLCFAALLAIHLFAGAWVIRHSPDPPGVDVILFHREAVGALVHGRNPYLTRFPDIYADARARKPGVNYYGPGLFKEGRSTFGFMYPSLSLLLSTPGAVLGGDFRYSHLVAASAAGLLMACALPGRVAQLAALLYLYTPRAFFIVEMGWTEPFAVLLLSLVVFCACRWPKTVPMAFGLLLAVKQYLALAAPATLLLMPLPLRFRNVVGFFGKAAVSALAVTLPLALWDLPAFLRSTVLFHVGQPFRADSLSFTAWLSGRSAIFTSPWIGFLMVLPVSVFVIRKAPRSGPGFASSIALMFLVFFALNQQAFANYYFFVIGALCCAVATAPREDSGECPPSPPLGKGI